MDPIEILKLTTAYSAGITVMVSLIAAIIKFWQYINIKRLEAKDKTFQRYHDLVQYLVGESTEKAPKLQYQICIVYELRNYPAYYPVTKRILQEWPKKWSDEQKRRFEDLEVEFNLTIKYIDQWYNKRFFPSF